MPDGEIVDLALDTAEEMTTKLSCFGVMMTKQAMWANLEITSLAAAIELENRNQLLAGYTGNLDEAIAAFREKRPARLQGVGAALRGGREQGVRGAGVGVERAVVIEARGHRLHEHLVGQVDVEAVALDASGAVAAFDPAGPC